VTNNTSKQTKSKKFKPVYKILIVLVLLLVIARLALPYIVLNFLNKKLAALEGYWGHIEDVDIALYRGAYQINKLDLKKIDKKDTIDFIYIKETDLAIEWKPIFKGSIVGKVAIDSGVVQVTREKNDVEDIAKDTADFRQVLKDMMPMKLNRLEMNNSMIRFRDFSSKPPLDLKLTNIHLVALNLKNAYDSTKVLPATILMSSSLYNGNFSLDIKFDPYADKPKFDMNATLEKTNLVLLNDFLKAYANVDVSKGDFGLYMEVAAKEGNFDGYVKPLIKDLKVVSFNEKEGNILQVAWESLVGTVAWVVTNKKEDQLATKVYLEGSFKDPKIKLGKAIITVLHNAFIKALYPSIDKEINLSSVKPESKEEKKGFFKKLFGGDNKEGKKKKSN
jgi:hypothetical protein